MAVLIALALCSLMYTNWESVDQKGIAKHNKSPNRKPVRDTKMILELREKSGKGGKQSKKSENQRRETRDEPWMRCER